MKVIESNKKAISKEYQLNPERPYFPFRFATAENEMEFTMAQFPESTFELPFINDGIKEYFFESPINRIQIIKNLDWFMDQESLPKAEPSGFIFHMSRCGSTLASQMLASLSQHRVVSEASVISHYISSCMQGEITFNENHFRWLVNCFGQPKNGRQPKFFIKFNSWNVLFLDKILSAFPDVPWIFLGRNPIEIMASNYRKPTGTILWKVNQNSIAKNILPNAPEDLYDLSVENYFALFLAEFLKISYRLLSNGGRFLDYEQLVKSGPGILDQHFNLSLSSIDLQKMFDRALYNAKNETSQLFKPDSADKKTFASAQMKKAVEEIVEPLWEKFKALSN